MARRASSKRKWPSSIKVGAIAFTVAADAGAIQEAATAAGLRPALGLTTMDKAQLLLLPGQQADIERDTLLHEVVHILLWFGSLGDIINREQEELFVSRITPLLVMLLRDNPELVKYVTAE